jgi:hypothetical protein
MLDLLDGPALRMLGLAILAFVVAKIVTGGIVPWIVALLGAAGGWLSWRFSRARSGSAQ